jgi:hypothetical protein
MFDRLGSDRCGHYRQRLRLETMTTQSSSRSRRTTPIRQVPELTVDYSEIGLAKRMIVPVTASDRKRIGDQPSVRLIGDSVESVVAHVVSWSGHGAIEVEIVETAE